MKTLQWAVGAALACAVLLGCEKSSETQKREAERSAVEADNKKKQAEATNETDKKAREAREAQEKADKKRGDLHATVVREKADYHAKLQRAIGDLEQGLSDLKIDVTQIRRGDRTKDQTMYGALSAKELDAVEALLIRRDRLMDHRDKIDATLDSDWPAFKRDIDNELETKGMVRPGRT